MSKNNQSPEVIRKLQADLRAQAKEKLSHAAHANTEAKQLIAEASRVGRIRGSKWVDVSKVQLVHGKAYCVRRVMGFGTNRVKPPVIAKWRREIGWAFIFGEIASSTGVCTIQVWQ